MSDIFYSAIRHAIFIILLTAPAGILIGIVLSFITEMREEAKRLKSVREGDDAFYGVGKKEQDK